MSRFRKNPREIPDEILEGVAEETPWITSGKTVWENHGGIPIIKRYFEKFMEESSIKTYVFSERITGGSRESFLFQANREKLSKK